MPQIEIIQGDAKESLSKIPDRSVKCCVTSPLFWYQRDYGFDGQLGLESTPEQFIDNLVDVFEEVRRVLSDDGSAWVEINDGYVGAATVGGGMCVSEYVCKPRRWNWGGEPP